MQAPEQLIVGTRGSALALVQADMTEKLLAKAFPNTQIIRNVIVTTGDRRTDVPLSDVAKVEGVLDKGVFTKELEIALENGEIDLAVHSLKDVPTVLPEGFEIVSVLERAPVNDVIITKSAGGLDALKQGATVATSSVRRQKMLLHMRPDLNLVDMRGNVPTRLRKLAENDELDGIIQQAGTPEEIFNKPKNKFVAGFIGSPTMNFLPAEIVEEHGLKYASGANFMIALDSDVKLEAGHKIDLGIRPEDITFDDTSDLNVNILVSEYVGHHQNVIAEIGGAKINITAPVAQDTKVGGSYKISIDQSKIHLFDRESGENLN